ncbi:alkylphosphonate utilization operon protein PhnA [Salegentibacter sp. 24]|uniref:PhnA domain-containing protein n=1 Tax=Salegentibacter sp. 24 TaxID=2183986 RepID=UPI001061E022|nr:alkylphosphonate utilization protein [Salegentibacter sp. 24]TDN89118.1 alkylphosphonate utilization operon protein PhnA [Salegentibacter sp. 24]
MSLEQELLERSDATCELCGNTENLSLYEFQDFPGEASEASFIICSVCKEQLEEPEKVIPNHWRCLNDSMWSTVPAVQLTAYQMLTRLKSEGWPQDLLDMMYMEDELRAFAKSQMISEENRSVEVQHKDCNGAIIESGDTVVLTKDLNVKGSSLTAKRGTPVRRISLVHDNPEQIEGKVDGQQIVILTKFVKKV